MLKVDKCQSQCGTLSAKSQFTLIRMMTSSATQWWGKTKTSFTAAWVILMIFSLCLSCLANTAPKGKKIRQVHHKRQAKAEVNGNAENNRTAPGNWSEPDEICDPVLHGEGRGGMKCLGCRYSADPAPKDCDTKKVYECYKGEVCVTRLQKSDSGKGHIEKGCTTMYKNKGFNKWINVRSTVMGDIQTQEMLCNETDCCNKSDNPSDAAASFKASLLFTAIMIVLTKLTKSMFNN